MASSMTSLERLAAEGHEEVLIVQDATSGLRAVIAIHDTTLGPAVGGTRMQAYPTLEQAAEDALRLSRAMTLKAALAGIPRGGGKAVILGDPAEDKTEGLLLGYARELERLGGRFFTAGDMGIGPEDLDVMARVTRHVSRLGPSSPVDPSKLAGLGVYHAIVAAARFLGLPMTGLRVAIQGVGKVGYALAERLAHDYARLTVADVVEAHVARAVGALGASAARVEGIAQVECDVFSPNAGSGVLDPATISRLRCRAVAGGANEQLDQPESGDVLAARGILWAPDIVTGAGALLSLPFELGETDVAGTHERVRRIGDRLVEIWTRSTRDGLPPGRIAERLAQEVLARARAAAGHA
jgi:leucine dehydrogenase